MKPMLQKFTEARAKECAASGSVPCVAVLGSDDFDTLAGELEAMFSLRLDHAEIVSREKLRMCQYDGVMIFRSASEAHGIMIGSPLS